MSVSINGTNGVTFNDGSVQTTSALTGFRNRIINGDMRIDQRNNGATVNTSGQYPVDRFLVSNGVTTWTAQQSTTAPAGFTRSLLYTSVTGGSAAASDRLIIRHRIEGFNWEDLGWGTASASAVTLSFWVRSSLTGTFSGSIRNSAEDRSYPFSFTVSSANTFERKTVTIPGDTSGSWSVAGNLQAVQLSFDLGSGSGKRASAGAWASGDFVGVTGAVSVSGTNGATFYITGVQLEAGSTATEFERRPYGTELALCQRYYEQTGKDKIFSNFGVGYSYSSTGSFILYPFKTTKRTTPTIVTTGTASNYEILYGAASSASCNSVPSINSTNSSPDVAFIEAAVASGLTVGQAVFLRAGGTSSSFLGFSSEL